MLIFPSEQSKEAELEPQKAVTRLVRQWWRERKGDPSPSPQASHYQHCLLLPSLLWKGSEAAEQGGDLQERKLPIPTSAANLVLHEAGRETLLDWLSSVLSDLFPVPGHSREDIPYH